MTHERPKSTRGRHLQLFLSSLTLWLFFSILILIPSFLHSFVFSFELRIIRFISLLFFTFCFPSPSPSVSSSDLCVFFYFILLLLAF